MSEALQSLRRSWKVSLVACFTIGVSLFLCGGFLVGFRNLAATVDGWREQVAVVVYLAKDATPDQVEDLRFVLEAPRWVTGVAAIDGDEAAARFEETFPRLAELSTVWEGELFPASLEAALDSGAIEEAQFEEWLAGLRSHRAALMVEADRDWLDQLTVALSVLRAGGLVLGAIFLAAAALTTSSVLRLVAQLQREEIAIMRLVGASELYIRGPFYLEGMIQGLAGAVLAVVALAGGFRAVPASGDSLWVTLFLARPAGPREIGILLGGGALVGLVGAILSLRREGGEPV